jgi:hypothetical protein
MTLPQGKKALQVAIEPLVDSPIISTMQRITITQSAG